MTDTLTESFCERCGTRYEFKAPTRLNPLRKTRGFVSGLRNYLTSQDALSDAMNDAIRSEEEQIATAQLDAFHESFSFCIGCRQYTCVNCWNDASGRCRSCAPIPGTDDLAERLAASIGSAPAAPLLAASSRSATVPTETPEMWPMSDLPATSHGDRIEEPAAAEPFLPEPMLVEVEPEPEPERVLAEPFLAEPVLAEAEAEVEPEPEVEVEPEPEVEVEPEPEVEVEPEPVLAEVEVEAVLAEVEPKPEPEPEPAAPTLRVVGWDEDATYEIVAEVEPEPEPILAEVEPEPILAEVEPEPILAEVEPEPILAEVEPEPILAEVEPEPILAEFEVEPEPVLAEVEPEPILAEVEPEPVLAEVEPEPILAEVEPEPILAEVEPEPILAEVEVEPEPVLAEVEPEPVAVPPITPISETILRPAPAIEPVAPATVPEERVAAEADSPELATRRAQLDLLGLGDPGEGSVAPQRGAVIPYRSRGVAVDPAAMSARAASLRGASFWEASAREVANAAGQVGVQDCGQCGLSLSSHARFCRRCGTQQARSA